MPTASDRTMTGGLLQKAASARDASGARHGSRMSLRRPIRMTCSHRIIAAMLARLWPGGPSWHVAGCRLFWLPPAVNQAAPCERLRAGSDEKAAAICGAMSWRGFRASSALENATGAEIAPVADPFSYSLWLCSPAFACCSCVPPRVPSCSEPAFCEPGVFLWLCSPAFTCCSCVPPRCPSFGILFSMVGLRVVAANSRDKPFEELSVPTRPNVNMFRKRTHPTRHESPHATKLLRIRISI